MSKDKPKRKPAESRRTQFTFAPDDDVRKAFEEFVSMQEIKPDRTAALNYLLRAALREKLPEAFA